MNDRADHPDHRGRRIEVEVTTSATPDEAWEAWASPKGITGWFVDRARGHAATDDVVTWFFDRFGYELPYRVVEAVPGERLVLGPVEGAPPFLLEIRLTREAGETRIRLVNSGFAETDGWDEQFEGIVSGWQLALGALTHYLERDETPPRADFFAVRPVDGLDYDALLPHYVEAPLLEGWLGRPRTGDLGDVGAPVSLELLDGGTLTGEVLARSRWEVALSWEEQDGVLQLKAFTRDGRRHLCLAGWGWGMDAERAGALEERMGQWLERLAGRLEA